MLRITFVLLLTSLFPVFSLVSPAPSRANTLVLDEQVNARVEVVVSASDGFSTNSDVVNLAPFVGTAEATAQGILNPELLVSSIVLDLPETTAELSFGSAQIPAILTFSAHYEWEPNQTVSIGVENARIPTGELVDFNMTGSLEAFGETIPFVFGLSDYAGVTELLGGSNFAPFGFAPDPHTFILGSSHIKDGFSGPLGEIAGVQFSIERALVIFESATFVPEPSTASLFALGLIGMAAVRRRRTAA